MAYIGILERGHDISDTVANVLSACGVCDAQISAVSDGNTYDAVIIGEEPPDSMPPCNTNILVLPDCLNSAKISALTAKSVISYGLRRKNTLTVSSLIGTRLVVSIQREIATLLGHNIGEQDFCIDIKCADNVDRILGIIATLLISDISPESISVMHLDS